MFSFFLLFLEKFHAFVDLNLALVEAAHLRFKIGQLKRSLFDLVLQDENLVIHLLEDDQLLNLFSYICTPLYLFEINQLPVYDVEPERVLALEEFHLGTIQCPGKFIGKKPHHFLFQ